MGCFGLTGALEAVNPLPGDGYVRGNTVEGQNALLHLSSGDDNAAIGFISLRGNMTGSFNTAAGSKALLNNTTDGNTGVGYAALLQNTTGENNHTYIHNIKDT